MKTQNTQAAQVANFRKNIMGTISFDLKLTKWRKSQDFIVYPMAESAATILIQSDKRWAEINPETGEMWMTNGKGGHPNSWLLIWQKARNEAEKHTLNPVDLSALKMHIFTTAGAKVGESVIYSDNSAAINII
jgi:hypothetical protein